MGGTFGNINVINRGYNKDDVRNKIIDWYSKNRHELSEDKSDINIKIIYKKDSKWFNIYLDIIADGVFAQQLKELSKNFCDMLDSDTLSVTVVDSDLLVLDLEYRDKKSAGLFVSDPGGAYFGAYPEQLINKSLSPFKYILNEETNIDSFENIYKNDYYMQEDRLLELSKLIGIDSNHIVLRYDDLEYFADKEYEVMDLNFTILDEQEKPFSIIREGLPKLKAISYGCNMVKGDIYTSSFLNIGGPSLGLSLYIGGEMIEKSINNNISSFKFGSVEAFYFKDHNIRNHDYYLVKSKFEVSKDKNEHYWLKADFNDFKIPNGILENPLRNKNFGSKTQEMIYGYEITFRFTLLSMDASLKGEAFIFATPFENFHEGMAHHNVSVLEDDSELRMAMQREMEEALKQMNMK